MAELKLLFLTPVEMGHSNVHRAICTYLLENEFPGVARIAIHILADKPARKQWDSFIMSSETRSLTFHEWGERSQMSIATANKQEWAKTGPATLSSKGFETYRKGMAVFFGTPADHLSRYERMRKVLADVKPDLVILDMLIRHAGRDAARAEGCKYVALSPAVTLNNAVMNQPKLAGFWKYPAESTNFSYPVPWYRIPYNITMACVLMYFALTSPNRKQVDEARKEAGIPGSILEPLNKGAKASIFASMAEMEYPHLPPYKSVYCGPILKHIPPISATEFPEISQFLDRKRTVVINLGSIFEYTDRDVENIASAIQTARARIPDGFQILWKLPEFETFRSILDRYLGSDSADNLIRGWVEPPALAILQHPNTACLVSHAGANSLIEAAYAGIPQIHFAFWFDLFTLASRSEWAGIGIYANKGYEPDINGPKFAEAIVKVLNDGPGTVGARMKQAAKDLSVKVQATNGMKTAAETIVNAALDRDDEIPFHTPSLPPPE